MAQKTNGFGQLVDGPACLSESGGLFLMHTVRIRGEPPERPNVAHNKQSLGFSVTIRLELSTADRGNDLNYLYER